jgi:hypothetical protein
MKTQKLLEAIADIAYNAGQKGFYSGDSRADISEFIRWANDFEQLHKNTDWGQLDYILEIEKHTQAKIGLAAI